MRHLLHIFKRSKSTVFFTAVFCIVVFAPFFGAAFGQSLDDAEVMDLFSQGKAFFRQANELAARDPEAATSLYEKSLVRFERIVRDGGIQNGKIYYNIGNTYFRMKDIGRAILNYRRAQQYIPNDANLQQNLAYARARRLDKIEEGQKTVVLKTLFFWHYDLSTRTRLIVFVLSYIFLWALLMVRFFTGKSILNWGIAFAVIFAVLFSTSLLVDAVALRRIKPGVIVSTEVTARKGNSNTYEPSFRDPLHAGTEFVLVEGRGDWYYIALSDSRRCWVPRAEVELVR